MTRHSMVQIAWAAILIPTVVWAASSQTPGSSQADRDRPSSLVQRPAVRPPADHAPRNGTVGPARFPQEFRTIDGTFNNAMYPLRGAAGTVLLRLTPESYSDSIGDIPGGLSRPNPRTISNAVCAQYQSHPNAKGASAYLWQWGQFLDHDIDETPIASPAETFDILIPAFDLWFDPDGSGDVIMGLDRSAYDYVNGVRQQLNNITAFIDASNVYGSESDRANELRSLDGSGRLRTSAGNLLPFNTNGFANAPTAFDPSFFLAGDVRANEQVGLTAMHVVWMREHNFWADFLNLILPVLSGDEVYEQARAIVAAEMQAITIREFLPVLLGPDALPQYQGYRPNVHPGISNIFATAAYRVGHTMLSSPLMRVGPEGNEIPAGHLELAEAFFSPQEVIDYGVEPLLRGLYCIASQEVDPYVRDDVRNFLFGAPGAGGFDLASLNIQRGRDHGLATYNQVRAAFGRKPALTFADINPDAGIQAKLAAAYANSDEIDAWVGMLAEPHRPGAMVGETLARVLTDQLVRLRDGDRFWYQSYLPEYMVRMVNDQTLATVIRRNTNIGDELPENVFVVPDRCLGDINGNGTVGIFDLLLVLNSWGLCPACAADVNMDDVVNVLDLLEVIMNWGQCP